MHEPGTSGGFAAGSGLAFEPITRLLGLLERGEVSAVELTQISIDRLNRIGKRLNAVAEITDGPALRQAADSDTQRAAGRTGSLGGIPWAPKDLLATAGVPTRWGAPPFRDQVFDHDATTVRRLRAHGAVMVGKLAMIELAGAGLYRKPDASIDGPCRNPWDPHRWAGGSSSGSAAAVAAGLVAFSIGSETAGSLVIPASFCGITALRPSYGLVSVYGALPVGWTLDKLGPMCRSAQDCALVLAAIVGADSDDPTARDWTLIPEEGSRFRIGVLDQPGDDPKVQAAFRAAVEVLETLGMTLTPVTLPNVDLLSLHDRLVAGETAAHHEEFIRGPLLAELVDDTQKATLAGYLERPPTSYPRAAQERVEAVRLIRGMFDDVDVIVAPTLSTEAVSLDEDLLTYRHGRRGGNMFLGSVAGVPELTLPMGFGSQGLPVGLSVIGDVLGDSKVLRIGGLYQAATSWHEMHPPLPEDNGVTA